MPRAVCRCGHTLSIASEASERVVCPSCGARVRVRVKTGAELTEDGFVRFHCPCGRRLKVPAENRPSHGKCPDCGRVVPVPDPQARGNMPPGHPETPTADLNPSDLATLERWTRDHVAREANLALDPSTARIESARALATTQAELPVTEQPAVMRVEAGLRTCPGCHRPVHLQAEVCHSCGAAVPRR
jgi:DNA-directed RNA polymerase subunit RPC12/RpoP